MAEHEQSDHDRGTKLIVRVQFWMMVAAGAYLAVLHGYEWWAKVPGTSLKDLLGEVSVILIILVLFFRIHFLEHAVKLLERRVGDVQGSADVVTKAAKHVESELAIFVKSMSVRRLQEETAAVLNKVGPEEEIEWHSRFETLFSELVKPYGHAHATGDTSVPLIKATFFEYLDQEAKDLSNDCLFSTNLEIYTSLVLKLGDCLSAMTLPDRGRPVMCFGNTLPIQGFFNSPPHGESLKFFDDYRSRLASLKTKSRILRYTFLATGGAFGDLRVLDSDIFMNEAKLWIHGYRDNNGRFQPFFKSSVDLVRVGLGNHKEGHTGHQYVIAGRRHTMNSGQKSLLETFLPTGVGKAALEEIELYRHFAGIMHENTEECLAVQCSESLFGAIASEAIKAFPRIESGYRLAGERSATSKNQKPAANFVALGWYTESKGDSPTAVNLLAILAGDVAPERDAVRLKLIHTEPDLLRTQALLNQLLQQPADVRSVMSYI